MRVKLPRLLDAGMKEKARLHPIESVEISLNSDPPSTASLTISKADAAVKIRDWIELYTKDGSAGIFRVTGVEESYDGEQVWITLEHGIVALGDAVIVGEGTFTGSLGGLMSQLLSHQVTKVNGQPLWRVGSTVTTKSVRRDYQNPNLLSELIALLGQAGDVMLTFDQSTLPWTVNLVALDENDLCEGRFGRNLQSLTVSVDDNDLCTRAIIDGTGEKRDADTISQYGVVARVLNVSEYATAESADKYIDQYLEAHKDPNVSIEISAVDMSETTGESIDSFRLGRMCRACLPDHGVTVKNRIVSLRLPDVYGAPQDVRVSLGKKQPTLTDLLMQEQRQSASTSSRVSRGYGSAMAGIESNEIRLEKSETLLEDARLRMSYAGIVIDGEAASVKMLATLDVVEDTRKRISKAGIDIDGDAANVKLFATQELVNDTRQRMSKAGIDIDGAMANIKLFATQEIVDDTRERMSKAGIDINGAAANVKLFATQELVEDTRQRMSKAGIDIDGDAANVKLFATQELVEDTRQRMSKAGIDIDGDAANVKLFATQELVNDTRQRMSKAGIDIDGAMANIKLFATQEIVDDTRERMSKAGIDINGAAANVKLFATQELVEDTRQRMSKAGIDIDGAMANVKLFATQEALDLKEESILQVTSDAISTKVSKDGVISSINQTAESIVISANKIDLSGYVTASQLSAEIADINLNIANTVSTDTLRASSAIIGYMTYADEYCTWKSKTVQTSVPDLLKSTITLANGNQMSVVTGWADAPSNYRSTLYYLSHN